MTRSRSSPIQPIPHAGLRHRPLRLIGRLGVRMMEKQHEHIVRSYEEELPPQQQDRQDGRSRRAGSRPVDRRAGGRDPELAAATINDEAIDALEQEIEEQAVTMIARRQPMAYDLRQIMAALRISTDLERIGDLGKNIAKRAALPSSASSSRSADARPEAYGRAVGAAERGARRLSSSATPTGRSRSGTRTKRSTPCTTRCSASCSPT